MNIITTTGGTYMDNTQLKMIRVKGKLHDSDIDEYEEKIREFNINVNAIQGYSLKKQKTGSYIEIFLFSSVNDKIQCTVKQNPGLLEYLNGTIEYNFSEICDTEEMEIEVDSNDDNNKRKVITGDDLFEFIKSDDPNTSNTPDFLNDVIRNKSISTDKNYYSYEPSINYSNYSTK